MTNKGKDIRAVIIDDMPLSIADLREEISSLDMNIDIVGTADGVVSGAKLVRKINPDLVFLDVHMDDGDGFDLLEIIQRDKIAVIFITASRDHAIKAFGVEATDYLLKPVTSDRLKEAIRKVQGKLTNRAPRPAGEYMIAINTQEEIRRVHMDDILRLEASGNYTVFYFKDGKKLMVSKTLKLFEKDLPDHFIRVHQSHLVNLDWIEAYVKTEGGYLLMKDGSHVPVSVRRKAYVIEVLGSRF